MSQFNCEILNIIASYKLRGCTPP